MFVGEMHGLREIYGQSVVDQLYDNWFKHAIKAAFNEQDADKIMEDAKIAGLTIMSEAEQRA
jgi:hypothetical protein